MNDATRFLSPISGKREDVNSLKITPNDAINFYSDTIEGLLDITSSLTMASIHKIVEEKIGAESLGVEPSRWFDAITGVINILKEVEDAIAGDLGKRVAITSQDEIGV